MEGVKEAEAAVHPWSLRKKRWSRYRQKRVELEKLGGAGTDQGRERERKREQGRERGSRKPRAGEKMDVKKLIATQTQRRRIGRAHV